MTDLAKLLEPFPKDSVSWRAQSLTRDGDKALALAYIDARDVMRRLDDVCSMEGWQCRYSHANGKTVCDIAIWSETRKEWLWKADGAGDSDIEAEKGALSDAFKRAAVRWGIGRYLYDLEAVWVPCESKEWNGKKQWAKWKVDPWTMVKAEFKAGFITGKQQKNRWIDIKDEILSYVCEPDATEEGLRVIWKKYDMELAMFKRSEPEIYNQLEEVKNNAKLDLLQKKGMPQDFNKVRSHA